MNKSGRSKAAMLILNKDQPEEKRTKPMLGFKNFHAAPRTIAGIEPIRIIQKGQIQGFDKNLL